MTLAAFLTNVAECVGLVLVVNDWAIALFDVPSDDVRGFVKQCEENDIEPLIVPGRRAVAQELAHSDGDIS